MPLAASGQAFVTNLKSLHLGLYTALIHSSIHMLKVLESNYISSNTDTLNISTDTDTVSVSVQP